MNSRERVLKALAHQEPDRVPFNLRPSDEMIAHLKKEQNNAGISFSEFFQHDVHYVTITLPERPADIPMPEWFPKPTADDISRCTKETAALKAKGVAVCGYYVRGVFEETKAWFGDAETLTMPFEDPDGLKKHLDNITAWKMEVYGAYAKSGVDIVWIGDDLGMQNSLIMSPEQYRELYRPCHVRIVNHLRNIRPDVRIAFHCCGFVTTLIPDLIEIGIDILEAVQAECMDITMLKKEFGKDISFWGGIGAQSVLARTTHDQVMEGVRKTLAILAPGGGYIAAPCHTLTEEVPWESVISFHKAIAKYGTYPFPGYIMKGKKKCSHL